ncbi:MAG: hypothetical protein EOP52_00740 [Sphingobacteriales bacterium]|nr:MAG: hypothetical protein EOP52_00740 [Sphingobacteriales bacterium]
MDLGQDALLTELLVSKNGRSIPIDKYLLRFQRWPQPHDFDTYGGKPLLNLNGEPLFAELALLRLLESQGYKGAWVDTFRTKFWQGLPERSDPVLPDPIILDAFNRIYKLKGGPKTGCFDIIAYREGHFVFAELKRKAKDAIRSTQVEWLEAALNAGFHDPTFFIAEWDCD